MSAPRIAQMCHLAHGPNGSPHHPNPWRPMPKDEFDEPTAAALALHTSPEAAAVAERPPRVAAPDAPPEEKVGSRPVPLRPAHLDDKTWLDIVSARQEEKRCDDRVEELKKTLSQAKEDLEFASKRLGELIDEAGGEPNLFNTAPATAGANGKPVPPADAGAWRLVPLVDVGLEPKTVDRLESAQVTTLGEVMDWINRDYEDPKVQGLTKKKCDAIAEKVGDYFRAVSEARAKAAAGDGDVPATAEAGAEPFDDDAVPPNKWETVAKVDQLLGIEIGQRAGGRWAYRVDGFVGPESWVPMPTGHFSDRLAAIAEGISALDAWATGLLARTGKQKLPAKARTKATRIRSELKTLTKHLEATAKSAATGGAAARAQKRGRKAKE